MSYRHLSILLSASMLLSACHFFGGGDDKREKKRAAQTTVVDGVKQVPAAADSSEPIAITSEGLDTVGNAAVVIEPGTLSVDQNISIGPGENLSETNLLNDLAIQENAVQQAGAPVAVTTDSTLNPAGNLQVQLDIPPGATLTAQTFETLIVIYKVDDIEAGVRYIGIIPKDQLEIDASAQVVRFVTDLFGTFQVVVMQATPAPPVLRTPETQPVPPPPDYAVTITAPAANTLIGAAGIRSVAVAGTCSVPSTPVVLTARTVTNEATCAADGTFAATMDLSRLRDGGFAISANHGGETGATLSVAIVKDATAPVVDAGEDADTSVAIELEADVNEPASYTWTQESGPSTVTFSDDRVLNPTVSMTAAGEYELELTATDRAGNSASDTVTVIWAIPARVQSISTTLMDGIYVSGQAIDLVVTFDQTVSVTGSPGIQLNAGVASFAVYQSGTNSNALTFSYTTEPNKDTSDLDTLGVIELNGGTIIGADGHPVVLTLPTGAAVGALAANSAIVIDTRQPLVDAGVDVTTGSLISRTASANETIQTWAWTSTPPTNITIASPSAATTNINATVEGTYTIRVTATDLAGLQSFDEFDFVWDTSPPSISAVNYANDATDGYIDAGEAASVADLVSASVTNATTVEYAIIDGGATCDAMSGGSFSTDVPSAADLPMSDGGYKVCVRAIDGGNPIAYMGSSVITKDTNAPGMITSFAISSLTSATPTLTWVDPTDVDLDTIEFLMSDSADCTVNTRDGVLPGLGVQSVSVSTPLAVGAHYACFRTSDDAGNVNGYTSFVVDRLVCDTWDGSTCTVSSNKTIASGTTLNVPGDLHMISGADIDLTPTDGTLTLNVSGDLVLAANSDIFANLTATVVNLDVQTNAKLSAAGLGYAGYDGGTTQRGYGPGGINDSCGGGSAFSTNSGSGGAHAGKGGNASGGSTGGSKYGQPYLPTTYGCGGGKGTDDDGSPGGGAIKVIASNTATVNGTIDVSGLDGEATGGNGAGGGGAGGSIAIQAVTLAGSGMLVSEGGSGATQGSSSGGGGGGYIFFEGKNTFTGSISVAGGPITGGINTQPGDSGRIFQVLTDICDSNNAGTCVVSSLKRVGDHQTIYVNSPLEIESGGMIAGFESTDEFEIYVNGDLTLSGTGGITGNVRSLYADNISISASAVIDANGAGFPSDKGDGAGTDSFAGSGGGAGHAATGGDGTAGGGAGYMVSGKLTKGSGGGRSGNPGESDGGAGGGIVRIITPGTITNLGTISADGLPGELAVTTTKGGGGGSGGSIRIVAGTLNGTGTISVRGGNAGHSNAGGGAGGYVQLIRSSTDSAANVVLNGGTGGANDGGTGSATFGASIGPQTIFVSEATFDGLTVGDLEGVREICEVEVGADAQVVLSLPGRPASKRLTVFGAVQNANGGTPDSIAATRTAFYSGSLVNEIEYEADGGDASNESIWTGTTNVFGLGNTCQNWTSNDMGNTGDIGDPSATDTNWISDTMNSNTCDVFRRVYCITRP